jgi:parvulin-like peptidyl-prolyl isomerase
MDQFSDVSDEEKAEKIHAAAEEIVSAATDESSFIDAVRAFTGEDTIVNVSKFHASTLSSSYKDWITDAARQPGDTTVVDGENLSYAIYFIGLDHNDYNTVDFRHILVMAEADEDGKYTDEALFAAQAKAEDLFAQWRQDPTEENFADLATKNSTDKGSASNGGLYEDVYPGQMVETFNDWCFDESRQPGDTGIVKTDYGYHIMYFVSQTENYYWKTAAAEGYKNDRMQTILDELLEKSPIETDYAGVVIGPVPENFLQTES